MADCPLIDPSIIDQCILSFENNNCDYLNNAFIPSFPGGMNCQVYYTKILRNLIDLQKIFYTESM